MTPARDPLSLFITGTDTGAGKTFAACALLDAARTKGLSTAAVKPLAAGGERTPGGLRNEDASALLARCSLPLTYQQVNPLCLSLPIAPHIAARKEQREIHAADLTSACREVMDMKADLTVIEGAGGWLVPLNEREFFADVIRALDVPVVLVVGMRLGCLNHALLSVRAIRQDNLNLKGWIANRLDPGMAVYDENLNTLRRMIDAPLLAELPCLPDSSPTMAAQHLDIVEFLEAPRSLYR